LKQLKLLIYFSNKEKTPHREKSIIETIASAKHKKQPTDKCTMRKTNHAAKTCPAGPAQCEQIILIYPTQINKVKKMRLTG
jgi:hypothetical protein